MCNAADKAPTLWACGVRGSYVAVGADYDDFGRNTSCYVLRWRDHGVIVDCGTGLSAAEELLSGCERIDVLFTHFHYDHVLGLFSAPWLLREGKNVHLWGHVPDGSTKQALSELARPPFWPVALPLEGCTVHELCPGDSIALGDGLTADTMAADHPNGGLLYRLTAQGKRVVFAFDREHGDTDRCLTAFAKGCALLIYDGMFTPAEYGDYVGWGHSTYEKGVALMAASGAEKLLITHHAPNRTDGELVTMERAAQRLSPACAFAREGASFTL